jgi:hypothetical protein
MPLPDLGSPMVEHVERQPHMRTSPFVALQRAGASPLNCALHAHACKPPGRWRSVIGVSMKLR